MPTVELPAATQKEAIYRALNEGARALRRLSMIKDFLFTESLIVEVFENELIRQKVINPTDLT